MVPETCIVHKVGMVEWQWYRDLLSGVTEEDATEVHEELVRMGIIAGAGVSGDAPMDRAGKRARMDDGSAASAGGNAGGET